MDSQPIETTIQRGSSRNLFPHLLRNYESLEIYKKVEAANFVEMDQGPASQIAVGQASVSAMEAPLHVLA